jgi:hypothetical protein
MKQTEIRSRYLLLIGTLYANLAMLSKTLKGAVKKVQNDDLKDILGREDLQDVVNRMKSELLPAQGNELKPKAQFHSPDIQTLLTGAEEVLKEGGRKATEERDLSFLLAIMPAIASQANVLQNARVLAELLTRDPDAELLTDGMDALGELNDNFNELTCSINVDDEDGDKPNQEENGGSGDDC